MKTRTAARVLVVFGLAGAAWAQAPEGLLPRFPLAPSAAELVRPAQPQAYFDKVGRKFALLGTEAGTVEAWAYPLKLLRHFELSFLIGSSTEPISGRDIVRSVRVAPEATTLTFAFQSFTVRATYVASPAEAGAVILLAVDATEPLTIVASFLPVLQPMWPAGLGGQYASWDGKLKAYLISEPTRRNHGFIGSPAAEGISYTPAHMLSDSPNQFKVVVGEPKAVGDKFIPLILAGGKGAREDVRKTYERLAADPRAVYQAAREHFRKLQAETLRVSTPERDFDKAFAWAKVAYDNLFVDNPDLGLGLVAGLGLSGTGGRPGFGWFFGGDAFMNSLSLNGYGAHGGVRQALLFARKWQREDGKMAHELSQAAGYVDWFKSYPYAYIHGDTTPFYIVACQDYLRMSGDVAFIREGWPSVEKAFAWCLTTDGDGDGLMDNRKAGLGALEFGALTGIQTDIYLASAGVKAASAMAELARAVGDVEAEASAAGAFAKGRKALGEKFWDAAGGQYAYAFNADGRLVQELTPWSAVPIVWGLADDGRGAETLERLNSSDLTTDWGVRMLSSKSPYYEPLNYNYGAVWPFLTGWVSAALYKSDFALQGYGLLRAAVRHTFDHGLGVVTELFSGSQNIWPQEAVAHQGFSSSGVAFPLVRGLLGLEGDAARREIVFAPACPADWPFLRVENYKLGGASFDLEYRRTETRVEVLISGRSASGFRFVFSPALGLGTEVRRAAVDGRTVPATLVKKARPQAVRPVVAGVLSEKTRVEIEIIPAPELLPPANETATGDRSRGLRVISQSFEDSTLVVVVEGLAGETYDCGLAHADRVASVTGASLSSGRLTVEFPGGPPGEYVRTVVRLRKR
ncbi:MAG: hypothetical protein FJY80_10375 [Candidatus Aminicenantes bacterium]|nr:hypothetical protein [Candidatus Aminicenantes bacterium]